MEWRPGAEKEMAQRAGQSSLSFFLPSLFLRRNSFFILHLRRAAQRCMLWRLRSACNHSSWQAGGWTRWARRRVGAGSSWHQDRADELGAAKWGTARGVVGGGGGARAAKASTVRSQHPFSSRSTPRTSPTASSRCPLQPRSYPPPAPHHPSTTLPVAVKVREPSRAPRIPDGGGTFSSPPSSIPVGWPSCPPRRLAAPHSPTDVGCPSDHPKSPKSESARS